MTGRLALAVLAAAVALAAPSSALACRGAEYAQHFFRPADAPLDHALLLRVRIARITQAGDGRPAVLADVLEVGVGDLDASRIQLLVRPTSCGPDTPAVGEEGWIAVRTTRLPGDPPHLILDPFSRSELRRRR